MHFPGDVEIIVRRRYLLVTLILVSISVDAFISSLIVPTRDIYLGKSMRKLLLEQSRDANLCTEKYPANENKVNTDQDLNYEANEISSNPYKKLQRNINKTSTKEESNGKFLTSIRDNDNSKREDDTSTSRPKIKTAKQPPSPHRLHKKINNCLLDWNHGLQLIFEAYPYLTITDDVEDDYKPLYLPNKIDGRSISSMIVVLAKNKKLEIILRLLDRVLILYRYNKDFYSRLHYSFSTKGDDEEQQNKESMKKDKGAVMMIYKSILGNCGQSDLIISLIYHKIPSLSGIVPSQDLCHAAMNALGHCGRVDLILEMITKMESSYSFEVERCPNIDISFMDRYTLPIPDRFAYQVALTSCLRRKKWEEALYFLERMKVMGIQPDVMAYNLVLSTLARTGNIKLRHKEAIRLLKEMEVDPTIQPDEMSYNTVISICGKDNEWDLASTVMKQMERIEQLNNNNGKAKGGGRTKISVTKVDEQCNKAYLQHLQTLIKVGRGHNAWYQIGKYHLKTKNQTLSNKNEVNINNELNILVGIQTHRHPSRNGLSIVFFDETCEEKYGFILIRNSINRESDCDKPFLNSFLVGMQVNKKYRGKGLANIFMGIWLHLCTTIDANPGSEEINKPLLALVLTKFGFIPQEGGVKVEVSPLCNVQEKVITVWNPDCALYSPLLKSLDGSFSEHERRTQKLFICNNPPNPRGKTTYVSIIQASSLKPYMNSYPNF